MGRAYPRAVSGFFVSFVIFRKTGSGFGKSFADLIFSRNKTREPVFKLLDRLIGTEAWRWVARFTRSAMCRNQLLFAEYVGKILPGWFLFVWFVCLVQWFN